MKARTEITIFVGDSLGKLGPDDSIVIHAHYRYGFTCGPEGMEFLTIRIGDAGVSF